MEHRVTAEEDGRSVRDLLRHALVLSEGAIRRAKWDGRILLNGRPVTVRETCRAGDLLCYVPAEDEPRFRPKPLALDLTIPWRDSRLLIIDKPAPLASQSGRGHPDDSLENAVFAYLGEPERFVYRPVNRLDRGTSGLMAVALTAEEQARLQRLLHTDAFRRVYLAVTDGLPPAERGVIAQPIAKAEGATIRRVCSPGGRPCVTHYEVLRMAGGRALLRLRLETGRTHQIRVHLASLGCPVFGDFLYGTESPELPGRFALHSAELTLPTPEGETVRAVSPLPPALERLLEGG
ncbi:MAG: RluA family pseudouridine synthase [Clostridia bacterium]|nr:RluA family pseudouridine synthase [Clostridia bacterium]